FGEGDEEKEAYYKSGKMSESEKERNLGNNDMDEGENVGDGGGNEGGNENVQLRPRSLMEGCSSSSAHGDEPSCSWDVPVLDFFDPLFSCKIKLTLEQSQQGVSNDVLNHKLIADIKDDIMDPVMQCTTLPSHSGFSQLKLVSFVMDDKRFGEGDGEKEAYYKSGKMSESEKERNLGNNDMDEGENVGDGGGNEGGNENVQLRLRSLMEGCSSSSAHGDEPSCSWDVPGTESDVIESLPQTQPPYRSNLNHLVLTPRWFQKSWIFFDPLFSCKKQASQYLSKQHAPSKYSNTAPT
ncbi:hypothetical protein Tco_1048106, partial [Tanacetum coccineum]